MQKKAEIEVKSFLDNSKNKFLFKKTFEENLLNLEKNRYENNERNGKIGAVKA